MSCSAWGGGICPQPPIDGTLIKSIPAEMKALSQWVAYTLPGLCPWDTTARKLAKTNKPETWGSFAQAVKYWQAHQGGGIGGIGFVLSYNDPYCIVDLSGCRNPETREIEPWARDIIDRLNSYTELSPSGRGVHIVLRGTLPGKGRSIKRGTGNVQLRGERYFFTMTGQHLTGTPTTIKNRKRELSALYFETCSWGRETPQGSGPLDPSPGQEHGAPRPLRQEELLQLAGTMRRQRHDEAGIRVNLQALNRASAAPLPECTIGRIARSAAQKPPGLTWKGDLQAAVQALEALGGRDNWVRHKDMKDRIKQDRNCSDTIAKEVIQKALDARRIVKGKNGFKGYKIRRPFRRVTRQDS